MRKLTTLLSIFGVICFVSKNVLALGAAAIGNEVPGARAGGQGYTATAAQNDDPNTVYSNPAGLTKLKGLQLTLGGTYINLNGSYKGTTGHDVKTKTGHTVVPNGAITYTDPAGILGFGVGVYSNYGLQNQWPDNSSLRYVATNSTLKTISLHPSVAVKVAKEISIGVGAQYMNVLDVTLERKLNPLGGANGADINSILSADGSKWGVQAGILIEPTEKHAFGIAYHSKMVVPLNGNLELTNLVGLSGVFGGSRYTTSAQTQLTIPQNLQIGYAYKPNEKFMWEVDVARFGWSDNQSLKIAYGETNAGIAGQLNSLGGTLPLKWRSTWNVATGVNYKYSDTTAYRVGFWYEPHATNEVAFNPAILDLSRMAATMGMGYNLTSHLRVDLAYNAIFFKSRSVVPTDTNTVSSTGGGSNINGTYKNFVNLVSISLTHKF